MNHNRRLWSEQLAADLDKRSELSAGAKEAEKKRWERRNTVFHDVMLPLAKEAAGGAATSPGSGDGGATGGGAGGGGSGGDSGSDGGVEAARVLTLSALQTFVSATASSDADAAASSPSHASPPAPTVASPPHAPRTGSHGRKASAAAGVRVMAVVAEEGEGPDGDATARSS